MRYNITKRDRSIKGEIKLEGSKSITNRVLIVKALCDSFFEMRNYSHSEDSENLVRLINSKDKVLHAGDGGTTLRFLTAYLAIHEGEVILTGSERLIDRPIGPLVNALISLGADIQYLGKKNYPPVLIRGRALKGNRVEVESDMSSQFVSALLLIAPVMKQGLVLKIKGELVSRPYIEMTLSVMKHFGIYHEWSQNIIGIAHQDYTPRNFTVEGDWSAASYFYSMAALADEVDLKLYGLNRMSTQGDFMISRMMQAFGISTTFFDKGVHLTKSKVTPRLFQQDFRDCPDLAQTLIACCAGANVPAQISGIDNLTVKETDRIQAMKNEMAKLGLSFTGNGRSWHLDSNAVTQVSDDFSFETYRDHRMAMALTPLAIPYGKVAIQDPLVVNKSYPSFWNDIRKLGFEIEQVD